MATAASDRLSDLSDDVLIHVLSFLPSKEAARTTVLSRRWRCPLWLDTGVLHLDSRSDTTTGGLDASPASDADHAVALQHSHGRVSRRISIVMRDDSMHDDVLRASCRDKAAVQEFRLDCKDGGWPPFFSDPTYSLPPEFLPFATLRILDINGCHLMEVRHSLWFPCLASLWLRLCVMELATLQDMVSSAPVLADLRLQSMRFTSGLSSHHNHQSLRCPAVTSLAITNLASRQIDWCTIKIDAPLLLRFRYTQHVWFGDDDFFKSPLPASLKQVDIEVRSPSASPSSILGHRECNTRVLKLTVFSIADTVGRVGIVPIFLNLEHLDIEELCGCLDDRIAAANALMNMLRCCPRIRDLRLKFIFLDRSSVDPEDYAAAMSELTPCTSSLDNIGGCCEVSYFPMSTPPSCRSMDWWRHSMRKVVLRSDLTFLTCFHVQLVSFLARNAVNLEEVGIVSGGENRYANRKVEEWRATRWTAGLPGHRCRRFRHCPPPLSSFPPLSVISLPEA